MIRSHSLFRGVACCCSMVLIAIASACAARAQEIDSTNQTKNTKQEEKETVDSKSANAFLQRAQIFYGRGEIEATIDNCTQAIRLDPQNAAARLFRGIVWSEKGELEKAMADFTEGIRLDGNNSMFYIVRGNLFGMKGDLQNAISDYDEAIRLKSAPVEMMAAVYRDRGLVWKKKGEYDRAIRDFETAIQRNPRYADAYDTLAWLLATCPDSQYRNGERAVEMATKAAELTGWKSPKYLESIAAGYAEKGDFEAAAKWQTKADRSAGNDESSVLSTLYQSGKPYRTLPTDDVIYSKLLEAGESMGWALMHSSPDEGLYVWRLNITSLQHPAWDGRIAWHVRRVADEIALNDPLIVLADVSPDSELLQREARTLQEEFKQRVIAKVGPFNFRAAVPSRQSQELLAESFSTTIEATEVPVVAGDQLVVISDRAPVTLKGEVVDSVARGVVLEIRGFTGDRLKVCDRRAGTINRQFLISLDEAIAQFSEEIRRNTQDSTAYAMRGNAWTFKGDYEKAFADLNRAVRLDPNSAFAFHRRGLAFATEGQLAKAIDDFSEALRLAPKDVTVLNDRGLAFSLNGNHEMAIADLDDALRQDPEFGQALKNRGAAWANKGEHVKAIADFTEALRLDPNDAEAFFNRGISWRRIGDEEMAASDHLEAVRINPKFLNT